MSKTNFDKWKAELKPKDLIVERSISDNTRCVYVSCRMNCPAENCPARRAIKQKKANWMRWGQFAKKCDKWFLRWANAEAEEAER